MRLMARIFKTLYARCYRDADRFNLKLNKDKCHIRCTVVPFFWEIISWYKREPDPQKIKALMEMPTPKNKKELQAFLGIINYLSKYSPSTTCICEPLQKLTLSKTLLKWNALYQALYGKVQSPIRDNVCMKFCDETKPLYLETDASGIGCGTTLLQTRDGMTCPRDVAPKHHSEANCICKQKSDQCRMEIQ